MGLSPLPTFQVSTVRGEDAGEEGPQALIQVLWTTIGIEGAPSTTPGRGPRSEIAMKSSVVFASFYESLSLWCLPAEMLVCKSLVNKGGKGIVKSHILSSFFG